MLLKQWLEKVEQAEAAGSFALGAEETTAFKDDLQQFIVDRDALQTEFDELNHMLTHQPPSAWAKREKKYHDDKKAWDTKEADFNKLKARLNKEIAELKADNRLVTLNEANAALEAEVKALKAKISEQEAALKALTQEATSTKAALTKLEAEHAETVRENVKMNMSQVKMESEMQNKNAEAAADKNRADELSRLLEDVRSKYNESNLRADGLKEQLESSKAKLATEKDAWAAEKVELQKALAVLQDASCTADDVQNVLRQQMQAAQAAAAELEKANADLVKQLEASEARVKEADAKVLEQAAAAETTALAAARLEITALKEAQTRWEGESVALKNESRALRAQLDSFSQTPGRRSMKAPGTPSTTPGSSGNIAVAPSPEVAAFAASAALAPSPSPQKPKVNPNASVAETANARVGDVVQSLNVRGGRALSPQDADVLNNAGLGPALNCFFASVNGYVDDQSTFANGVTVASAAGALDAQGGKPLAPANGAAQPPHNPTCAARLAKGFSPNGQPFTSEQSALLRVAACTGVPIESAAWAMSTESELYKGVFNLLTNPGSHAESVQWARIGSNATALEASVHLDGSKLTDEEIAALEALVLQSSKDYPDVSALWQVAIEAQSVPSVVAKAIVTGKLRVSGDVMECISEGLALPPAQVLLLRTAAGAILAGAHDAAGGSAHGGIPPRPSSSASSPNLVELPFGDLAAGQRRDGSPLASGEILHLRETAVDVVSGTPALTAHWGALPDGMFVAAFASALATQVAMYPDSETAGKMLMVSLTEAQLRTLRRVAQSVSSGSTDGGVSAAGHTLPRILTSERSADAPKAAEEPAARAAKPSSLADIAYVPNSPDSRALRQYAAEKELEAELHKEQVKKLMQSIQEKDDEMAELENRIHELAASTNASSTNTSGNLFDLPLSEWNLFGASKKAQNRIKQLETQLKLAEERMRYYQLTSTPITPTAMPPASATPTSSELERSLSEQGTEPPVMNRDDEKAYWMGENTYLMNQLVQAKIEMAERNTEYMGNKRALARSLERERALRDENEELQIRMSKLQDEYNRINDELQAHLEAAASPTPRSAAAATPSTTSRVTGTPKQESQTPASRAAADDDDDDVDFMSHGDDEDDDEVQASPKIESTQPAGDLKVDPDTGLPVKDLHVAVRESDYAAAVPSVPITVDYDDEQVEEDEDEAVEEGADGEDEKK